MGCSHGIRRFWEIACRRLREICSHPWKRQIWEMCMMRAQQTYHTLRPHDLSRMLNLACTPGFLLPRSNLHWLSGLTCSSAHSPPPLLPAHPPTDQSYKASIFTGRTVPLVRRAPPSAPATPSKLVSCGSHKACWRHRRRGLRSV